MWFALIKLCHVVDACVWWRESGGGRIDELARKEGSQKRSVMNRCELKFDDTLASLSRPGSFCTSAARFVQLVSWRRIEDAKDMGEEAAAAEEDEFRLKWHRLL